jgi:glucose-1-phosphate thymidylyltransferase
MIPQEHDVIGLIPAAGRATRLGMLPCSKELHPVGFQSGPAGAPKVICHYLLDRMHTAGITRAYIILRAGKWDIPAYFGDGTGFGMHLAYLLMGDPFGSPYSLDQAWPFVKPARIALGFPDILFKPTDAYTRLLARQSRTGADIVLGLFRASRPQKCDMVELDANAQVRGIVIKPPKTKLHYAWMIAVWGPAFTRFMHAYLAAVAHAQSTAARELFMGDVMQAAIDSKLKVEAECFDDGWQIDIGTPEELREAIRGHPV